MRRFFGKWVVAALLSFGSEVSADDLRAIDWAELLPQVAPPANPFDTLSFRQSNDLATLYRIEVKNAKVATDFMKSQAAEIRAKLRADGLDPDWYLQQRDRVMSEHARQFSQVNPDVLGQTVRVPGYIVPLEMQGLMAVEFLLVPTAGACIHTPPPPANQLIHIRYPDGYPLRGLYDPVWVDGTLSAEVNHGVVTLSDGQRGVASSYAMQVSGIEQYR